VSLNLLQKTGEHLPLGCERSWEAWPVVGQMFLRPAEPLATGRFTFAEKRKQPQETWSCS
jgi:hypothetical protein